MSYKDETLDKRSQQKKGIGSTIFTRCLLLLNMSTVFEQIIARKIKAHIIAEDAAHIAFLDIHPFTLGHTLVVPKRVEDYFFDLPEKELGALMAFAKRVAIALKENVQCERVATLTLGLEVAHAHLHLIPITSETDFQITARRPVVDLDTLARLAEKIRKGKRSTP